MSEMQQNTFGGQALPRPAGELMCSPRPLATIRGPSSKGKLGGLLIREDGKGGKGNSSPRKVKVSSTGGWQSAVSNMFCTFGFIMYGVVQENG